MELGSFTRAEECELSSLSFVEASILSAVHIRFVDEMASFGFVDLSICLYVLSVFPPKVSILQVLLLW